MSSVLETLPVSGMDCPDCARSIERGVAVLPGVRAATVSFATGRLAVEYEAAAIDQQQIVGRVRELGYEVPRPAAARARAPSGSLSALAARVGARGLATVSAVALLAFGLALDLASLPADLNVWGVRAATIAYAGAMLVGGYHVALAGWRAFVLARTLDMNALMSIAAIGAAALGEWTEAATVVFLFALGNALEAFTVDRARGAIRELVQIAPLEARVRRGGADITISVDEALVGDLVRVRPGERIPLDGRIVAGASSIDQAAITGESVPVDRGPGDDVFAGTVNGAGYLEVEATRPYRETTIAQILRLVEQAQASRAPTQRLVDRFAARYTPAVVALAVAIALVPPLALGWPLDESIYRALVLLVIACPCALVISTPVAIVSAIARAARDGVLIKGGAHLETLGAVRAVLIDKTGTLTLGRPSVVAVLPADQRDRLIGLAAAVEARSEHPFARAIVRYAQHEGIAVPSATGFEALPGRGARAELPEPVMVGSPVWLTADGVDLGPIARDVEEQEALGRSALVVAVARRAVGVIAVADQLRPHARLAVWELGRASIGRVVMLTGDNARAAAAVGAATGIGDVRSGLLPGDKVAAVRDAIGQHGRVAMLGDGVNDAPALAAASVGIAMGAAGSAAAIESADVALMGDELTRLPEAIVLARRVLAIIRQNVAISLLSKGVFLLLGVVGVAGLWLAVLADMGTSLLVTVNGMRLLRRRPSME